MCRSAHLESRCMMRPSHRRVSTVQSSQALQVTGLLFTEADGETCASKRGAHRLCKIGREEGRFCSVGWGFAHTITCPFGSWAMQGVSCAMGCGDRGLDSKHLVQFCRHGTWIHARRGRERASPLCSCCDSVRIVRASCLFLTISPTMSAHRLVPVAEGKLGWVTREPCLTAACLRPCHITCFRSESAHQDFQCRASCHLDA